MISTKHKCIFVHIPKTGGTSIESLFSMNGMQLIDQHYPIGRYAVDEPKYFKRFFKFSFVRNPWELMVSYYTFIRSTQRRIDLISNTDFIDWIGDYKPYGGHPQWHFVTIDGEVAVDFIGRYENLHADVEHVRKKLKLKEGLPHLNKTKHRKDHYSKFYTPRSFDLVMQQFEKDIEFFGYTYEEKHE